MAKRILCPEERFAMFYSQIFSQSICLICMLSESRR